MELMYTADNDVMRLFGTIQCLTPSCFFRFSFGAKHHLPFQLFNDGLGVIRATDQVVNFLLRSGNVSFDRA